MAALGAARWRLGAHIWLDTSGTQLVLALQLSAVKANPACVPQRSSAGARGELWHLWCAARAMRARAGYRYAFALRQN